jgi:hypothetical protein
MRMRENARAKRIGFLRFFPHTSSCQGKWDLFFFFLYKFIGFRLFFLFTYIFFEILFIIEFFDDSSRSRSSSSK